MNFKTPAHRSKDWLEAVAQIPCVYPVNFGRCGSPVQVAHRNKGKGLSSKTDDCQTAALCPEHHHEIDNGKGMTREQRRARMDEAIVLTHTEMVRRGLLVLA